MKCLDVKFSKSSPSKQSINMFVPIYSKEVILNNVTDIQKINSLYCLEKLTVTIYSNELNFENKYVKQLILIAPEIERLTGIEKFTNLEYIELVKCDKLYDIKDHLQKTNIKKIIFTKCGENQKRNMISYCNAKNIELIFN